MVGGGGRRAATQSRDAGRCGVRIIDWGQFVDIVDASIEDAPAILALQQLAYQAEAALYNDYAIAPLTQTLADLQGEFGNKTILKAVIDGRLVGSVRANEHDGTCRIGRLIVHPDLQRRGIGTALMNCIESRFPLATRFELFTGHKSDKNIRFYERLGYFIVRRETVSAALALIYMEKRPGSR